MLGLDIDCIANFDFGIASIAALGCRLLLFS